MSWTPCVEKLEDRSMMAVGATFSPPLVVAGTGFDGVIQLGGGCSGVLLEDGRHVLTAAHCVDDGDGIVDVEEYDINFDMTNGRKEIIIESGDATDRITLNPDWLPASSTRAGGDLAIIELPEIGAGGRSNGFGLYRNTNEIGQVYNLYGYGRSNSSGNNGAETPSNGFPSGAIDDNQKRRSSNVFESDGARILHEVQSVEVNATGGTFTLGFNGDNTAPIAFNASAATVELALESLPAFAPSDIQVFGGPGRWFVHFVGSYAGVDVDNLNRNGGGLTGGTASIDVDEEVEGDSYTMNAASVLLYDFDNGLSANDALGQVYGLANLGLGSAAESIQAAGDSGGPFLLGNLIAGIVSRRLTGIGLDFGSQASVDVSENASTFGEIGVVTRVSFFAAWIDAQLADTNIALVLDMSNQNAGSDGADDTIEIEIVGGQFELRVNGTLFYQDALADIASLEIRGSGDNDTLIVDYSGGNPIPAGNLAFDGNGGFNTLIIRDGTWSTNTYTYLNATDGSVVLDASTIAFADLSPIVNTGTAADIVFNLPAGVNGDVVLQDDGFGADPDGNTPGASAIDGSTFEFTQFTNPTNSLTINLGDSGDTLQINGLDAGYDADLTVNGGAGGDEIEVNAVTGSTSTWTVNGNAGTDTLIINYPANVAFTGVGEGTVTSTDGLSTLEFTSIEDFQLLGDYGDAPDTYGTSLAVGGAQHPANSALFLGAAVDSEINGLPSVDASADDLDNLDDEDGIAMASTLVPRLDAKITIEASAAGKLDAWIDYNGNGVFDAAEQIATSLNVVAGLNTLIVTVPATAVAGDTFARFRISSAGGLGPTGPALDGEVEDYPISIFVPEPGTITLLEDPANPGANLLLVNGRAITDAIVVQPVGTDPTLLQALISPFVVTATVPAADVQRIAVFGGDGNDSIVIDSRLTIPAQVFGDAGNDSIVGGSGNDWLEGNDGNDTIVAGAGNDVVLGHSGNDTLDGGLGDDAVQGMLGDDRVIGGLGRDYLSGGQGTDWLIGADGDDILQAGGTTLAGNRVAIEQIMTIWTSNLSFNNRVAGLAGLLNAASVTDDGVADYVYGNTGQDWFLDFQLRDFFLDFNFLQDRRN